MLYDYTFTTELGLKESLTIGFYWLEGNTINVWDFYGEKQWSINEFSNLIDFSIASCTNLSELISLLNKETSRLVKTYSYLRGKTREEASKELRKWLNHTEAWDIIYHILEVPPCVLIEVLPNEQASPLDSTIDTEANIAEGKLKTSKDNKDRVNISVLKDKCILVGQKTALGIPKEIINVYDLEVIDTIYCRKDSWDVVIRVDIHCIPYITQGFHTSSKYLLAYEEGRDYRYGLIDRARGNQLVSQGALDECLKLSKLLSTIHMKGKLYMREVMKKKLNEDIFRELLSVDE